MRSFWPVAEAAQADYEILRQAVLAGHETFSIAAGRFERRGLAGLIAWPNAEPIFAARVVGATRPPWTPHADPRLEVLAAGFELLVAAPIDLVTKEAHR
ncbi:MAG: hypothetical protein ACRDL4_10730 [Thermoleophilaceae bacterium]